MRMYVYECMYACVCVVYVYVNVNAAVAVCTAKNNCVLIQVDGPRINGC